MEKEYHFKRIDNLGRIVIPMSIRKALEIKDWDELQIELRGREILITKARDFCALCGAEQELFPVGNKFVCQACLEELKNK